MDDSVQECADDMAEKWDRFVDASSGTYCHLYGWKRVIERTYGLETLFLAWISRGSLRAILPVAVMPNIAGCQRKAVSLPYCNYGGLLPGQGIDPIRIRHEAARYLAAKKVPIVEFREMISEVSDAQDVTMTLSLPESADLLWKQLSDKVRNQVRKAQRAGLSLCWGREQSCDLYEIYAKSMRRLGTPVHSRRFIEEIVANFPLQTDILTVRLREKTIGAMLVFKRSNTWADPIASCLKEYNTINPNMLLYWEGLRAATEAGVSRFDFGRSQRDSGTYRFKSQWGAQPTGLNYRTYINGEPSSKKRHSFYRSRTALGFAAMWKCLPYPLHVRFGPALRRWVP